MPLIETQLKTLNEIASGCISEIIEAGLVSELKEATSPIESNLEVHPNQNRDYLSALQKYAASLKEKRYSNHNINLLLRLRELYVGMSPSHTYNYGDPEFSFSFRMGGVPLNLDKYGPLPKQSEIQSVIQTWVDQLVDAHTEHLKKLAIEKKKMAETIEAEKEKLKAEEEKLKKELMAREDALKAREAKLHAAAAVPTAKSKKQLVTIDNPLKDLLAKKEITLEEINPLLSPFSKQEQARFLNQVTQDDITVAEYLFDHHKRSAAADSLSALIVELVTYLGADPDLPTKAKGSKDSCWRARAEIPFSYAASYAALSYVSLKRFCGFAPEADAKLPPRDNRERFHTILLTMNISGYENRLVKGHINLHLGGKGNAVKILIANSQEREDVFQFMSRKFDPQNVYMDSNYNGEIPWVSIFIGKKILEDFYQTAQTFCKINPPSSSAPAATVTTEAKDEKDIALLTDAEKISYYLYGKAQAGIIRSVMLHAGRRGNAVKIEVNPANEHDVLTKLGTNFPVTIDTGYIGKKYISVFLNKGEIKDFIHSLAAQASKNKIPISAPKR